MSFKTLVLLEDREVKITLIFLSGLWNNEEEDNQKLGICKRSEEHTSELQSQR